MKSRIYLAFGISIFTLSQAAVLVRLSAASPEVLGFWRMVFSLFLSFGLIKMKKETVWNSYVRTHFKEILWAGLLFFLHFWLWFHAVARTTIANSTLLFCMNPFFVTFFVFLQKQKLTWPLILALISGITGLTIMEWNALSLSPEKALGDVLALVASVAFAVYVLSTKKLRQEGSNFVLVFWFNLICLIGFGTVCLMSNQQMLDYPLVSWLSFIGMAVGPSLLGHALFSYSLKYLNAAVASCFVLLEPVFAAITASWIFGEKLATETVYGFIIISAGLTNLFLQELRRKV